MMDWIVTMLSYPFMQRALLAGIIAAVLLGSLGVYVVTRKMSFIGDGIAHASLAGVALGVVVGWQPIPLALVVGVVLASLIFWLEHRTNVSSDTAIGIIFTAGMAIGVVLLHFHEGFQPDLVSFLFGNILAVGTFDLLVMAVVGITVLGLLYAVANRLTFVTIDPEGAYLAGLNPERYILLLYILTAIAIVISIQLVGIVLVSALLILPSAMSRVFANSFTTFQQYAFYFSLLIVIAGIILSYGLDLPTGATIILTGATLFLLLSAGRAVQQRT